MYLPELLHNITLLVEKTEHEIVTSDKKYVIIRTHYILYIHCLILSVMVQ